MCSAFNEQVLSEACDRYKDVPAGDPGDFEGCQTEQAVAKKFVEGVRQKLPTSSVANCLNQAESSSTGWAGAAYCPKNALKRADEIQKCM